jgi:glycosyltransferase involved in cell wall biosynthesis
MEDSKQRSFSVLMTTDTVGGVWTYSLELCRALRDVDFHLVTSGARMNEGQKREIASLANVEVYESEYALEWMDNPWDDIDASGEWLLHLEKEVKPDVVHLNSNAYGTLPFKAPKIVVAHSDVFSWWLAVKGENPPKEWNEYYFRVQAGLQDANLVIAPSKAKLRSIKEIYGALANSKVVYNGRNKELFYKGEKGLHALSMGRVWDEAKNIRLLVDTAAVAGCEIRIAGEQQFANNMVDIHSGNTRYLGKLDSTRVAEELAAASIYVLPAKYEPFGLSALEAAYSGCALVLGNIPSLREIWGFAAIYVDTNDPAALAASITDLVNNQKKREEYGKRAQTRSRLYSAEAMAAAYREIYHDLKQPERKPLKQETL